MATEEQDIKALAVTHGMSVEILQTTAKVESIVQRVSPDALAALPAMTRTVVLAKGMHDLRQAMTKDLVSTVFMPLQGYKLGFRTDKDKEGGYPWEIVRDVAIEAMVRGFQPCGNEFNIIGGNFYATKEGMDRKVSEFPGLTNLNLVPGVPKMGDGGALVPYEATWKINGKPDRLECKLTKTTEGEEDRRIPVKVNSGQGADAILGKAERKMLARIYKRISGQTIDEADVVDTVGEAVVADRRAQGTDAATQDLINKHKAKSDPKNATPERQREMGEDG